MAPGSDARQLRRAVFSGNIFTRWDSLLLVVRTLEFITITLDVLSETRSSEAGTLMVAEVGGGRGGGVGRGGGFW